MPFLMTDEGLVNLAHVETARSIVKNGRDHYLLKDREGNGIGIVASGQLDNCVEYIIVPSEPYDCLQIWFEGDEHWVAVDDVIAWALTVTGWVLPITADDITPKAENNYALRRRGQERVEVPMDASFDNEAEWVADQVKRRKREEERKAAAK